jgi:hypothetical protein
LFRSPKDRRRRMPSALLLAAVIVPAALPTAASASSATTAYKSADRAVVAAAKRVSRCQGRTVAPLVRCSALQAKLQSAGLKLSAAQLRLPKAVTAKARAASAASTLKAPSISVSGLTVKWTKVGNVSTYVFVAKSAGKADQYSVVNGTSTTPATLPGTTVSYGVRTAVTGSAWSKSVAIVYPKPAPAPAPAPTGPVAPTLTVSGQTLRWTTVGSATTYVLVSKVAGEDDNYKQVTGTSVTPTARPGKTVKYSVRADIDGGAWAPEVAIAYAATSTPVTTTPAPPASSPSGSTTPAPSTGSG